MTGCLKNVNLFKNLEFSLSLFKDCVILEDICKIDSEIDIAKQLSISVDHNEYDLQLTTFICTTCKLDFSGSKEQRLHFKTDWHRYNLHQIHKNHSILSELDFNNLANESDSSMSNSNASSISAADSDTDLFKKVACLADGTVSKYLTGRYAKIYFCCNDYIFSMFTGLLFGRQNLPNNEDEIINLVRNLHLHSQWAVLLLAGGYFAGAVFSHDGAIICHKTHKRYVTRRKQGGMQSIRDATTGGTTGPKSAGAQLRRYCEQALRQDIQNTMREWAPHLKNCHAFFIRAAAHQKATFIGDPIPTIGMNMFHTSGAFFASNDPRLRSIPLVTRRPSLEEVHRVHNLLGTIELFDKQSALDSAIQLKDKSPEMPMKNTSNSIPQASEAKKNFENHELNSLSEDMQKKVKKNDNLSKNVDFTSNFLFLATSNPSCKLKEFIVQGPELDDFNLLVKQQLFTAIISDDLNVVSDLLAMPQVIRHLNQGLGKPHNSTILHMAAECKNLSIITALLDAGADPTCRDALGRVPYDVMIQKSQRNVFRHYMGTYPQKWDWQAAHVPAPLSDEQELIRAARQSNRNRQQKMQRRERDKKKRAEELLQKQEEEEQQRYLQLSDREKRALAAERRMANEAQVNGLPSPRCVRCFQCAEDISFKIPFEYSHYLFCSTTCLRQHRLTQSGK